MSRLIPINTPGMSSPLLASISMLGGLTVALGGVYVSYTTDLSMLQALPSLVIGLFLAFSNFQRLWLDRRFSSRRAVIQEKSVRRGAQFHFTFQQKFQVRTELISVGIFLVFRETLKRSPPWDFRRRQPVFDRLIGSFQGNSRTYEAGDALTENCSFEIPDRAMGVRNPFNKHGIKDLGWVLKIRLDLASENTVWREYRLELDGGHVNNEADHPPYQRFDVYLVGEGSVDYWGLNQVVNKALSHHVMPGGFLVFKSQEILLLERRTLVEAELLKDQLTALGAVVDIRPAV